MIHCKKCEKKYIRETKRTFRERFTDTGKQRTIHFTILAIKMDFTKMRTYRENVEIDFTIVPNYDIIKKFAAFDSVFFSPNKGE